MLLKAARKPFHERGSERVHLFTSATRGSLSSWRSPGQGSKSKCTSTGRVPAYLADTRLAGAIVWAAEHEGARKSALPTQRAWKVGMPQGSEESGPII